MTEQVEMPRQSNFITDLERQEQELASIAAELEAKRLKLAKLKNEAVEQQRNIHDAVTVLQNKLGNLIDEQAFINFWSKPYVVEHLEKNKLNVYVPKFAKNFQVGWRLRETDTFVVYRLDQYNVWLDEVPQDLLSEIDYNPSLQAYVENGHIHFKPAEKERVKKVLGRHLTDWTDTDARIIAGHSWDVLVESIEAGNVPYAAKPVLQSDIRDGKSDIILRSWQQPAFDKFMQSGAIGSFLPTGAGKSFIALKIMDILKGKKMIIVDSITLAEQWTYYIEQHIPHAKDEVTIATYQGFRYKDEEYTLTIFDECHRLPAETFSRLATINTKYRIGLSATPFREDKKEKYIYALTGFAVGTNWNEYMKAAKRLYHPIHLYIVRTANAKLRKLEDLLDRNKKTFIYCDTIELGKQVAEALKVPYIYGETRDRLDMIESNKVLVVSRVADAGVSVKDLQRIIEIDFLFGSRQQELQRTGRLMHSLADSNTMRHDILMTEEEMRQYGKRLWSLTDKGFNLKIHE